MKKSANLAVALIGLMLAMPAMAQEEAETTDQTAETTADTGAATDEAAAAEEAAPAEALAAEGETAETAEAPAATEESAEAPADDASAAAPAEEAPTDAAAAEATEPAAEGEAAATEESAPAEGKSADASVEAAPMEESAAAEEPASGEESSSSEEMASEDSGSSEESSSDGEPLHLYAGVDKAEVRISFSDDALATKFGSDKINSSFYRLRVGTRVFDAIGIEAHYGISDQDDSGDRNFEVGEYYGAFVVPTGVFLDVLEISAPIGYTFMKAERAGVSEKFDAVSFGLNIELPILFESEWIPEIRIGGGGTVYQAKNDARVYGYHFGLRLDFKL